MKKITLDIEGMTCAACSNGLEKYLNKKKIESSVNLILATATISYDETKITIRDIQKYIEEAGFKSKNYNNKKINNILKLFNISFFSIIAILLMYIMISDMFNLSPLNIINPNCNIKNYLLFLFIFSSLSIIWGFDIIKSGLRHLLKKMPNMDSLIGIGVIVNFLYSIYNLALHNYGQIFFESVIMITLFVKIGRYIDKKNRVKVTEDIKNLVTLTPKKATILTNGTEREVLISEIKKGNTIICRAGEQIAVDGIITKGATHIDESFITGESKPTIKKKGDTVLAGSVNYDGYIEYEATKIGKDSTISHIINLVVDATNSKTKISSLADKISGNFVMIIFGISLISFIANLIITKNFSVSLESLVTVLVVACPCSLGLATPLAMVVSIGNASKNGLIIKSSSVIEKGNKIDTIIFDKTGTITSGELKIIDSIIDEKYNKREILSILERLESKSSHPLARSITKNKSIVSDIDNFEEIKGMGISGVIDKKRYYAGSPNYLEEFNLKNNFVKQEHEYSEKGESLIYLWTEGEILALFGLRDEIKKSAKHLIDNLKKGRKKLVILSGDNEKAVLIIAKELGIQNIYSNKRPDEKVEIIKKMNTSDNVLMLGDGINDSPALKSACIGISVSNGTDISRDVADIIMVSDDLNKVNYFLKLSFNTIKIIKENLFWALFYNLCMVPLATGLLPMKINPMIASFAMVISSITVILNSLRIRNICGKDK